MTVLDKIKKVREKMNEDNTGVYIVTSSDYHNSEYTGDYFETRKFLSGFTGSNGTLVIGLNEAALFTDGRYFLQAENELVGSNIILMKMGIKGTPSIIQYVESLSADGKNIAADLRTIPAKDGISYNALAKSKNAELVHKTYGDDIWSDRPAMSKNPAFELGIEYAGESRKSKLLRVREKMNEAGADSHVLTTLDDIAWLLNIRGNDILYNPMVLSYLYLTNDKGILFADKSKFSDEIIKSLYEDNIIINDYFEFDGFIRNLQGKCSVLYDPARINYYIYNSLPDNITKVERENPEILMKAVKNKTEADNERKAHIKDGVAVTKFIYWLKKNVGKIKITEVSAAEYLEELRKKQEGYIEPSFSTISAYKENAAMMHYNPYANETVELLPEGMLLVDSGGQYYEGTTDITRTIALGEVSEIHKVHYTAVLRGMLRLSDARFLKGCIGMNLDILARGPLWEMGLDYRCGTGHGVGYLLGVHEAPNGFRWRRVPEREDGCVISEGMITTDEPGVYVDGSHGIRIENELLTVKEAENEYGEFLKFETLTMAPVEMDLIDWNQMSDKDIVLLKNYQQNVYDCISKYLENDEKEWLCQICCKI